MISLFDGTLVGNAPFSRSHDAPHKDFWYECHLSVSGVSVPGEDDVSEYSGTCARRGRPA